MRLSPTTGKLLMGQGAGTLSINGATPASLSGYTGGGWGWLDDDTCAGQADPGSGFTLYQLVVSTDTLTALESPATGVGANQFRAGNGQWAAWLGAGTLRGVRGNYATVPPILASAALGDIDEAGRMVVITDYASGNGLTVYATSGGVITTMGVTVVDGTNRIRSQNGAIAQQDTTTLGWHLRNVTDGSLLPFAPRQDDVINTIIPVSIAGTLYVVERSDRLTIRPATASTGYVLQDETINQFFPDAVELTSGTVRVCWSIHAGELPTEGRCADLTIGTGPVQFGSTSSGSLVFGTATTLGATAFVTGPVEGGTGGGTLNLVLHQPVVNPATGYRMTQPWAAALGQLAAKAAGATNLQSGVSGVLQPDNGGTGTTTGLGVIIANNVSKGTLPQNVKWSEFTITSTGTQTNVDFNQADFLRCDNASALTIDGLTTGVAGQRLVIVAIDADVTLVNDSPSVTDTPILTVDGADLTLTTKAAALLEMDGTDDVWRVIQTSSGVISGSWIPLVDGSEPPNLVSDGAGHLILVAYP